MRGTRAFKHSSKAVGGFTEAVLALMIVTLSVILLSASFSITSIDVLRDGDEDVLSERCEDVRNQVVDDELLWAGDAIVLSSFDSRASYPYEIPTGLFGYELSLTGITDDNASSIVIFNGTEVEGADVHAERYPVLVMTEFGTLRAGMIEVKVW
jgi:hypothetical protein